MTKLTSSPAVTAVTAPAASAAALVASAPSAATAAVVTGGGPSSAAAAAVVTESAAPIVVTTASSASSAEAAVVSPVVVAVSAAPTAAAFLGLGRAVGRAAVTVLGLAGAKVGWDVARLAATAAAAGGCALGASGIVGAQNTFLHYKKIQRMKLNIHKFNQRLADTGNNKLMTIDNYLMFFLHFRTTDNLLSKVLYSDAM